MELLFLNKKFELISAPVDRYHSLQWEENYYDEGKFELHLAPDYISTVFKAEYIYNNEADEAMQIIDIQADDDGKRTLRISGESLESLLKLRVMDEAKTYTGTVEEIARQAVTDFAITGDKAIPLLELGELNGYTDTAIATNQVGAELYEWLWELLKPYEMSFKIHYDYEQSRMTFTVYRGLDRTQDQDTNTWAIFSTSFENLSQFSYARNRKDYRNYAIVMTDSGTRVDVDQTNGEPKCELFVSASDDLDTEAMTQLGVSALAEYSMIEKVSGEVQGNANLVYGVNYALGDRCNIEDSDLGVSASARLTQMMTVVENGATRRIPAFGEQYLSLRQYIAREVGKSGTSGGGSGGGSLPGTPGADGADGKDGFSPIVTITTISGGHRVTITDVNGTESFDVLDGEDGEGGAPGADGYSPKVTISSITGGHRVTVTDASGSKSFDVMDGEDGSPGATGPAGPAGNDGSDGYSPTVKVTTITGGRRVTVTDASGTKLFDVMDGEDGSPGKDGSDGYSPTVSITTITGGHRVTITDATSAKSFDVMDGEDADNDAVWEQINANTEAIEELAEAIGNGLTPLSGYNFYTSDSIFTVPDDITAIRISACAAGVGRYAGEYILDYIFNVTPGQQIELTIGSGNTIIGDLITLIAGTVSSSTPTTKLGYAAGYNGGNGGRKSTDANVINGYGGYGGAFGYGGGGGGGSKSGTTGYAGGGGGGIGGAGGTASTGVADVGAAGGTTGGAGGRAANSSNTNYANGGDAKSGKLIYTGAANNGTTGGSGSIYGAGGGGGAQYNGYAGGGGAAGGYGAGGGTCGGNRDIIGQPSNGMVLIEWGGTVGE